MSSGKLNMMLSALAICVNNKSSYWACPLVGGVEPMVFVDCI